MQFAPPRSICTTSIVWPFGPRILQQNVVHIIVFAPLYCLPFGTCRKLSRMKCVVLLLSLLVLTPLTQACDASDASSCIATYLKDVVLTIVNSNTVCSVTQNAIACLNKACPSGVSKTYVDTINKNLQKLGSKCDLSGLKTSGVGMDGCPSLRIVIAIAALVSVFLCG